MNNPTLWKTLATIATVANTGAAGFCVILTMAWMTLGVSEERREAIDTVAVLGFLGIPLIIGGLAIWKIWAGKFLTGLGFNVAAWIVLVAYIMGADLLVTALARGK
jgi:hypothetical protein